MRKPIILSTIVTLLSFGMIDSAALNDGNRTPNSLTEVKQSEELRKQAEELKIKQYHQQELENFLDAIGFRESSNDYTVTNKWGYMGKYQFGRSTLKGLGYKVTKKEFLNNPQLQEEAMMALLLHNKEKLQKYIDVFDGQTIEAKE